MGNFKVFPYLIDLRNVLVYHLSLCAKLNNRVHNNLSLKVYIKEIKGMLYFQKNNLMSVLFLPGQEEEIN